MNIQNLIDWFSINQYYVLGYFLVILILAIVMTAIVKPQNISTLKYFISALVYGVTVPGILAILEEMGVPAKALTDLDFVFVRGVQAKVLDSDHELFDKCYPVMLKVCEKHGFEVTDKGLPKKTNGKKASEAYERFAEEQEAIPLIEDLYALFIEEGYWVWTKGAIEKHLGLEGKQPKDWHDFVNCLEQSQDWKSVIDEAEHEFVASLCRWITA